MTPICTEINLNNKIFLTGKRQIFYHKTIPGVLTLALALVTAALINLLDTRSLSSNMDILLASIGTLYLLSAFAFAFLFHLLLYFLYSMFLSITKPYEKFVFFPDHIEHYKGKKITQFSYHTIHYVKLRPPHIVIKFASGKRVDLSPLYFSSEQYQTILLWLHDSLPYPNDCHTTYNNYSD